jgi:hypothetical protein
MPKYLNYIYIYILLVYSNRIYTIILSHSKKFGHLLGKDLHKT